MSNRPGEIEYHVWHTSDGEIRGVGFVPPDAPPNIRGIPIAPSELGLQVTTVVMPSVDPSYFENVVVRNGALVERGPRSKEH